MKKEIVIDGVKYELTHKKKMSVDDFIKYVKEKNDINFNIGDVVWFKEENVRKECGESKFKVLSFEPYLINGQKVESYLSVNLESLTSGNKINFLTSHLEKYTDELYVKEIKIDGIEYVLIPKQR